MMKKIDYNEFDSIKVYVKGTLTKEIVEYYKLLCWKLTEENENKRYEDIVDLTFVRPHKIENKDELQLTQVYMEDKINFLSRIKKHKHSLSLSLALCFAIFGLALVSIGILSILNILTFLGLAFGIVFTSLGGVLLIGGIIITPRLIKKEKIKYNSLHDQIEKELLELSRRASELTGGKQ